jgi:transcriptional regulator with GAF, ATPase, and Fis domain
VLQEQKPVIINDCKSSPYFYDQVDNSTGFITRNMIATPLIADRQLIGVIEVLNKNDGLDFVKSDADLVLNISNEVSFAVRNARIFEYVVTTYCKILQGGSPTATAASVPCATGRPAAGSSRSDRRRLLYWQCTRIADYDGWCS